MNFLVWRLHRNQAYFAVAALAVLAVVLLVTGTVMGDDYRSALASCGADAELRGPRRRAVPRRRGDHRPGRPHAGRAASLRPLLGGPVAVEGVRGRHAQPGVDARGSRRHWLRVNIGWSLRRRGTCGARRWRHSSATGAIPRTRSTHVSRRSTSRASFPWPTRSSRWRSGSPSGSVMRRVLPSLAVTLAVFVALARRHRRLPAPAPRDAHDEALPTRRSDRLPCRRLDPLDRLGQRQRPGPREPASPWHELPAACRGVLTNGKELNGRCLASHGFHQLVTYQPDSRFWAFQGMEAGIFLVLALGLVGFTWWWVRWRDA